jgi:NAD(P)-dependent dehydrogenase (short-subunit alcohol dehydrogenase family)
MKAAGKILLVTGAGSGIGRQLALEALRLGAKVAAVNINDSSPHRPKTAVP